jgi:TolB-like protein/DNA-binding winged helix-turn-helix (wHTH) protein
MSDPKATDSIIRFQRFELDLQSGDLRKDGTRFKLQNQPFRVLAALLERPGQVVTREDLRRRIWPNDSAGDFDHAINLAIGKLRTSLGDSADVPHLIETVPKRGYRFICTIEANGIHQDGASQDEPLPGLRWKLWLSASLLISIAVVALLLGYSNLRSKLISRPASESQIHSLAVLPLKSLSSDQNQDYFAEGMTDSIITELGKIGALRVISHQSVMQYKGTTKSVPEIARELNADAIVEGSIMRAGAQVRITVQLIDGRTDHHLWADSYQRDAGAILSLQNDLAKDIAAQVKVKLTPQEKELFASAPTVKPEAHEAYLKGLYFVNRWPELESIRCIESFQRATEIDPSFAAAQSGLATCYTIMPWTLPPKEVYPKAKAAAQQALRLDANQAEAYAALGAVNMFYEWDWGSAEQNLRRAVELNPNRSYSLIWYSNYHSFLGHTDEAIREAKQAVALDPVSVFTNRNLAFVYQLSHKYPEYATQAQTTLELAPNNEIARWDLAYALALQGKRNEAIQRLAAVEDPLDKAIVLATLGENEQARRALKKARAPTCPCTFAFAAVHALLNERDVAIQILKTAFDERDAEMVQLNTNPAIDSLRTDSRVQTLLRRMNFTK